MDSWYGLQSGRQMHISLTVNLWVTEQIVMTQLIQKEECSHKDRGKILKENVFMENRSSSLYPLNEKKQIT